jgi:tetratricopeptide (TPR) repeat protein
VSVIGLAIATPKEAVMTMARRSISVTGFLATLLCLGAGRLFAVDPPAGPQPGMTPWLAGDAPQAVRELMSRTDRESVLNRNIARVYAGEGATAEQELQALLVLHPRWTPALRWLARARAASGSARLGETVLLLLTDTGATSRDFLWVGQLRLDRGEWAGARACLRQAVAKEQDLYLGWLWLGDAEAALGQQAPAREAWLQARDLHAGGDVLLRLAKSSLLAGRRDEGRRWLEEARATPEGRLREDEIRKLAPDLPAIPAPAPVVPPLNPGEKLRYSSRYLFIRFATLETENQGWTEFHGRRAAKLVLTVRSNRGFRFLDIDSRFESLIAEDGSVLAHRNVTSDSVDGRRATSWEMDPATGRSVVRFVVDGLYGFDRLPLPPLVQDGLSVPQLARGLAGTRRLSVLTAIDGTWKGTQLRTVANGRVKWAGRSVDAVQVESEGRYKGPAGLSGVVRTWIGRDARAIPYEVSFKLALGAVVLELSEESGTVGAQMAAALP